MSTSIPAAIPAVAELTRTLAEYENAWRVFCQTKHPNPASIVKHQKDLRAAEDDFREAEAAVEGLLGAEGMALVKTVAVYAAALARGERPEEHSIAADALAGRMTEYYNDALYVAS